MSERQPRVVAPGEIRVPDFLNALRIPVLAEEPEGEFWISCPFCEQPSCHVAEADNHRWLVFYCEACKRGAGETGVNLWMHVRDVIDVLAIRQMKQRFYGYKLKPSRKRQREQKAEHVVSLYMDYTASTTGATTSKFVRTVLAPDLGINVRNAWKVWGTTAVRNALVKALVKRCEERLHENSTVPIESSVSIYNIAAGRPSPFTNKDATSLRDSGNRGGISVSLPQETPLAIDLVADAPEISEEVDLVADAPVLTPWQDLARGGEMMRQCVRRLRDERERARLEALHGPRFSKILQEIETLTRKMGEPEEVAS